MDADSIVIKARVTKRNVEGVGADIHLCVLEPVRAAQASGFTANAAATVSALQLLKKTLAKNSTCKGLSAMPAPAPAPAPAQAFLHRDGEVQHSAHVIDPDDATFHTSRCNQPRRKRFTVHWHTRRCQWP